MKHFLLSMALMLCFGLTIPVAIATGQDSPKNTHTAASNSSAKMIFDLGEMSAVQTGSLHVDGSYGVLVKGFNRLRKQVKVTVGGRDVFREALGPFKSPADTPKEEERAGGAARIEAINNIDSAIKDLESLRDDALTVVDRAYSSESPVSSDYDEMQRVLGTVKTDLTDFARFTKEFTNYVRISASFQSAIRQIFARVKGMIASPSQVALLAKESEYTDLASRAADVFDMISDKTLDHLAFGLYQATNDVVTVTLKIRDLNRNGTVSDDETTLTHDFRVSSGFKIDFSAGLLIMKLEDYSFKAVAQGTTPETYRVVATKQDGTITTATFIHFRGLFGMSQDYGLSLGMALQERPYYALGVSYHPSSTRQRLVLTAGIAFRSVTRYEGADIISTTEIATVSKLRNSAFFALSYNF